MTGKCNLPDRKHKEAHMKQNVLPALLALMVAIGTWSCGSRAAVVVDTTQHDNWVQFLPWEDGVKLSFELSDHSITSGQPWGGVSTGEQNQIWGINVPAGRHKSSSVAHWFRSHCSSAAWCVEWPDNCPGWPSDLNFAITGTLTINGTGYPITLGQGSTGIYHNDWWIGGPGWTLKIGYGMAMVTPDGKYYFEAEDGSFNQFSIGTSF
jgi:hypothetical protein